MEPNRPSDSPSSGAPGSLSGSSGGPTPSGLSGRGGGQDPFAGSDKHTAISEVGEFGLIAHLRDVLGDPEDESVVSGISDDAAVYRVGDEGRVHLVTSDALLEGVHFDRTFMPMEHLGFKAMSVNVSDIVAMNAEPRYATVTLGIPQQMSVEMVGTLYQGIKQACDAYGVTVVGGDTTGSRGLEVNVTVIGEANEEDVVYRNGARVGDKVCVTGDIGASYAGLKVLDIASGPTAENQDSVTRLDIESIDGSLSPTFQWPCHPVVHWGVEPVAGPVPHRRQRHDAPPSLRTTLSGR